MAQTRIQSERHVYMGEIEMNELRHPRHTGNSPTSLEGQQLKTDQSQGNDTDVNKIVARFARTGELPPARGEPQYADVTGLQGDLTELLAKGESARKELQQLENEKAAQAASKQEADQAELQRLRQQVAEQQESSATPETPA